MAYWIVRALLTPFFWFFYRIRVEGAENLPKGRAIFASNHLSVSDSFFLPAVVPRRMTFVAKAEYFDDPKTAWFFRSVGQIPVDRSGGSKSEGAINAAASVLDADGYFGIYPEGTRSPDGRLYRGHTGIARLALRCDAPILPVAMIGTTEAMPPGEKPKPFKSVTIRIGKPLTFEKYRDRADDPRVLRQITDEVMFELVQLSGQEYVDRYAKKGESTMPVQESKVGSVDEMPRLASAS